MKKLPLILASLILLLVVSQARGEINLAPAPQGSQLQTNLEFVGAWPYGGSSTVAVDQARKLAFNGLGAAFVVTDITDPANPQVLSDRNFTGEPVLDLFYDSTTQILYVATGTGGLGVWDVSQPQSPQELSRLFIDYYGLNQPVIKLAPQRWNNYIFITSGYRFVYSIDISDPANPAVAYGSAIFGSGDVFVYDGRLYVVGDVVGEFVLGPDGRLWEDRSNILLSGSQSSLWVTEDYIYLTRNGDLVILDRNTPFFDYINTYTYPSANAREMVLHENLAYLADPVAGMHIVDVSDPLNLVGRGTAGSTTDLTLDGSHLYMARGTGYQVIDVSNADLPQLIGSHDGVGGAIDTIVDNGLAYVATGAGLAILDASQPLTPTLISYSSVPTQAWGIDVVGNYAYVADQIGRHLRVFDISDPAQPEEKGSYAGSYYVRSVRVAGSYAYLAESDYGLRIVDVTDKEDPIAVSGVPITGFVNDVALAGDYAFVAASEARLHIINIADPINPVPTAVLSFAGDIEDVAVVGNYAYLAYQMGFDGGLLIVDISDPANPQPVADYFIEDSFPTDIFVSGGYAYLIDFPVNVYLFDVFDPAQPQLLESLDPPGGLWGIFVQDGMVYFSAGSAGLQIYRNLLPQYRAALGGDSQLMAQPGQTITHTFSLQNLGLDDSYTLSLSEGNWPTTLLSSSPVTLTEGQSTSLAVVVQVPLEPATTTDSFILTVTSTADPALILTATGITRVDLAPSEIYIPLLRAP